MAAQFVYFRLWPGFTSAFPFGAVNHLEGEELIVALDKLAEGWASEHPEEIARYLKTQKRKARVASSPVNRGYRPSPRYKRASRMSIFRLANWISTPGVSSGSIATEKHWLCEVQDEEQAAFVCEVLSEVFEGQGLATPRWGCVPVDSLSTAKGAVVRLAIEDLARLAQEPLSSPGIEVKALIVVQRVLHGSGIRNEVMEARVGEDPLAAIPPLDKTNWVPIRIVTGIEKLGTETLGNYRRRGRRSADGLSGRDPSGRTWRKPKENGQTWYLRSSLTRRG